MSKQKNGKNGIDSVIEVPPGTIVYDLNTNEIIKDFSDRNETFHFLKGGKGGKGNIHFKTSTNKLLGMLNPDYLELKETSS